MYQTLQTLFNFDIHSSNSSLLPACKTYCDPFHARILNR